MSAASIGQNLGIGYSANGASIWKLLSQYRKTNLFNGKKYKYNCSHVPTTAHTSPGTDMLLISLSFLLNPTGEERNKACVGSHQPSASNMLTVPPPHYNIRLE